MRAVLGDPLHPELRERSFLQRAEGAQVEVARVTWPEGFFKETVLLLILDCSHEVGCADSELYVHEFAIRQTVAV